MKDFQWAYPKEIVRKRKSDTNCYRFPSLVDNSNLMLNVAKYNYITGVVSFEITWKTEYQWLDTRTMRRTVGKRLAEAMGVERFIYYVEQPKKARSNRGEYKYSYFQQFVCESKGIPDDDRLRAVYDIMTDCDIEGEESSEYKYKRFDQGGTPIERTYEKRSRRKISS